MTGYVVIMKKLLATIILNLCFTTQSIAENIKDFQIEGLSIGESALKFFNKDQIKNNKKSFYRDDKYIPVIFEIKTNDYDWINFHYKKGDKNYIMDGIRGGIAINYNDCMNKLKEVEQSVSNLFIGYKKETKTNSPHGQDKTGRSFTSGFKFQDQNGDRFTAYCDNFHKDMRIQNSLNIGVYTSEFMDWIGNKAYK